MLTIFEHFIAAAADDYLRRAITDTAHGHRPSRATFRAAMTVTWAVHTEIKSQTHWASSRAGLMRSDEVTS